MSQITPGWALVFTDPASACDAETWYLAFKRAELIVMLPILVIYNDSIQEQSLDKTIDTYQKVFNGGTVQCIIPDSPDGV